MMSAGAVKALADALEKQNMPVSLSLTAEGARGYLAYTVSKKTDKNVFYICENDFSAKQAYSHYPFSNRIYLPSQQTEIGIIETKSNDVLAERARALVALRKSKNVIFMSVNAFLYKMCEHNRFYSSSVKIRVGDVIKPFDLITGFLAMGYERTSLIDGRGQISGRGEIVEVFPPDRTNPVRITFFDDEIESIKLFNEENQRSFGDELESCEIYPAHEFIISEEDKKSFNELLLSFDDEKRKTVGERFSYEMERYSYFPNIEAFTGLINKYETIVDYADNPIIIIENLSHIDAENSKKNKASEAMLSAVLAESGAFGCENGCFEDLKTLILKKENSIIDFEGITQYPFEIKPIKIDMGMYSAESFHGSFKLFSESLNARIKAGYSVYMYAGGRAKSLAKTLAEENINIPLLNLDDDSDSKIGIFSAGIYSGFEITAEKILFLSEENIFGTRKTKNRFSKNKKQSADILSELKPGDIVVHELHGKGRFIGIKNMEVGGVSADYIELEYKDGDKLFIQTAQIDRIQKYIGPGSDDENAHLSKLGTKEWDNQKAKARKSIKKLAEDLQKIYSDRAKLKGYSYSEDTVWQREFEENFEHEETEGQVESILQIKKDMQSPRIMDRLLLGDVGYGKTEVAMRACFKAVMDSKQVAVLVPTTLLARQHYTTFKERFSGFPVKIAVLSRFTEHPAKVLEGIENGSIDIVIGTHKLLSKSVVYKNLGLLVVDEEQRFGVSHKERIKDMKRTVDVLTLTATPIPRTLEMALTGIRDMSTIDTPPAERKEVQAYVTEFSHSIVREAVMKELARGGQIFFVCPKIAQMDELARILKNTVPEVKFCVVHGQMEENEFENVVSSFIDRKYDLMLCTTIIESGIDIPAANTMIVYQAEAFGLAQLYQLKGRVGRSSVRAYAYFTHLGESRLTEIAAKRLAALREFTQFGSGLKIAMKDLEIRGAGNILGAEQSGHMAQIGYSLYCKLVREEISSLNSVPVVETETNVEFGINAFISSAYISDEAQKMDMYRRISSIHSLESAKDVRKEFIDRFGPIPKETENLLTVSVIKAYAQKAHISSLIRKKGFIEIKLAENAAPDAVQFMRILARYSGKVHYRKSTPPALIYKTDKSFSVSNLITFIAEIGKCVFVS